MWILSFIISLALFVLLFWDYFATKKKEESGLEFLHPSSISIGPIFIVFMWAVFSFLMMLGLVEVESKM